MGNTPNEGEVKVKVTLVTDDAKRKLDEIQAHLRKNEKVRKTVVDRINREGFDSTGNSRKTEHTITDRLLEKIVPKMGGYNPNMPISRLSRFADPGSALLSGGGSSGPGMPGIAGLSPSQAGAMAVRRAFGAVNPFPTGGISGSNALGGPGATVALAGALYAGANKASKFIGQSLAYKMQSGEASVRTGAGGFLNELNSTFSYINNYIGSYRDAETRLADWDDAVSAVTGKLPETQVYRPLFQSMAQNEMMYQEMIKRNASLTKAGALGASKLADQLQDAIAHGISR